MALIDRYVDPSVVGGLGDGTSWANAYDSLSACESGEDGDLQAAGNHLHIHCRAGESASIDTTGVLIGGWSTSISAYIQIMTDTTEATGRHAGKLTLSNYFLKVNDARGIYANENHVNIIGIQIEVDNATTNAKQNIYVNGVAAGGWFTIQNNILLQESQSVNLTTRCIELNDSDIESIINNNICYNASSGYGIYENAVSSVNIFNNTVYSCSIGIVTDDTLNYVNNNLVNGCAVDYSLVGISISSGHNIGMVSLSTLCFGAIAASSNTTSTQANYLVDSGASFCTSVHIGAVVKNSTDTTFTYVTSVHSNTTCGVANDIFTNGEKYLIYTNIFGSVAFVSAPSDNFHLDSSDTVAVNNGEDLSGFFTDDIDGDTRS